MNQKNLAAKSLPMTWEPKALTVTVIAMTLLAALSFMAMGGDALSELGKRMWMFTRLKDSFGLTMLTTGTIFTAVFTGLIAWAQVRMAVRVTAPVLGVAVVWAGAIDVMFMVMGDSLIADLATDIEKANVLAFVWAVCRTTSVLIMLSAVVIILRRGGKAVESADMTTICIVAPLLFVAGYLVAKFGSGSDLVQTTGFLDGWIKRPWDLMPMIALLIAATLVYPFLYQRVGTLFALALWLSLLPELAAHLHLAFFSSAIFDAHFFIAQSLLLIAYLTRLGGILLDHSRSYVEIGHMNVQLQDEIEERVRAQEAERETEHIYQQLVEALPIAIFRKDVDGKFDFVNQRMCDLVRLSKDDMIGMTYKDVYPAELADEYQAADNRVMQSRETIEKIEPYRGVNAGKGFVHYIIMPVINHKDEVVGVRGLLWDVTELFEAKERLEAQTEELVQSETQRQLSADALKDIGYVYKSLVEPLPIAVFRKDNDGYFTFVNDRFCEAIQMDRVDVLGQNDRELFGDRADKYERDDNRVLKMRQKLDVIEEDPYGKRVRTFKSPIIDGEDKVIGLHGVFWEVPSNTNITPPDAERTAEPSARPGMMPPAAESGEAPADIIEDKADEETSSDAVVASGDVADDTLKTASDAAEADTSSLDGDDESRA
ncbi:MAG: PAS domain-containing protein [Phycisphaera sp.]|nr:PAS domain-containing protein [Phycisphaera sp.]